MENNQEGIKYDEGKLDYGLLDPEFITYNLKITNKTLTDKIIVFFKSTTITNAQSLINCLYVFFDENEEDIPLKQITLVAMYGAQKYSRDNWKKVNVDRYISAFWRHLISYLKGNKEDEESGFCHLSHVYWNIMAIWYLKNN